MSLDFHFIGEEHIPSPALIYYKDSIIKNTKKAIETAHGPQNLWPHIKSHKSPEVLDLLVSMGILRFKCATIAELEIAAETDATDLLFAYPLIGPNIPRYLSIQKAFPKKNFYTLADNVEQAKILSDEAIKSNVCINVLIDINPGMNRTGVAISDLPDFYSHISAFPNLYIKGIHCYDGNRHEEDYALREHEVLKTIKELSSIYHPMCLSNPNLAIAIMGGSPTFPCYAQNMPDVFYSPGTVFIYDIGYKRQFPDLPYDIGAAVMARVISHPDSSSFTLDVGYKSISAEQKYRGILPELPYAQELFQSEEHWVFQMLRGHEAERPEIGSIVYILPWHICPTTALYDQLFVVEKNKYSAKWNVTARKRFIHF